MANSEDDERKSSFIRERVVGNRRSKKELLMNLAAKFFIVLLLAVIFGIVAGVVFAKVSSAISKNNTEDYEHETLSIPRDEDNTDIESSTQTMTEEQPEFTTEAASRESLEDVVQNAINGADIKFDIEDYASMYEALSDKVSEIGRSVVTISSKEERVDWFDNSIENDAVCAGIIWNITDSEILVAAICDFSENTPSIEICFSDGAYADAYVKGYDSSTGLTVIAVPSENISPRTSMHIDMVELGNSYIVSEGEPVIIAGNPSGYIGSVLYGNISYMIGNMFIADMSQKGLLIDAHTYEGSNGFVINYKGELLGLYGAESSGEFTKAYGISDMKGILEKLSNSSSIAYLGIIGQAVTSDIAEQYGLIQGIYITETVIDEAAYAAGIKSGDIIVSVDGEKVFTLHSLQNILEAHSAGDTISVAVMRNGTEEYTEIVFDIELSSR